MQDETAKSLSDFGLLLIRLMLGVVFMFHGGQKLFGWFGGGGMAKMVEFLGSMNVPAPNVSAALAAGTEFFGGLLVLVGLLTRLAAIPMVFNMVVAVLLVHRQAFSAQNNGMEYPLTLAVVLAGLGLIGPGRLSLDGLFFGCCKPSRTPELPH